MSSSSTSADSSSSPSWRSFSSDQLHSIDSSRLAAVSSGLTSQSDPKGTYGLICPACTKPNTLSTSFCTGCAFPLTSSDVRRLPDNIFLELVKGKDIGATVRERTDEIIVFDDKFPVGDNHIDVIPTQVYVDISVLGREHIPILEKLYESGKREILRRNLSWLNDDNFIDWVSAGYNFPVSVKHLHLHMMVPPYKHEKILQYPRWHSHEKVVRDLKEKGKVVLYSEVENKEEGEGEQIRAVANSKKITEILSKEKTTSSSL